MASENPPCLLVFDYIGQELLILTTDINLCVQRQIQEHIRSGPQHNQVFDVVDRWVM